MNVIKDPNLFHSAEKEGNASLLIFLLI